MILKLSELHVVAFA